MKRIQFTHWKDGEYVIGFLNDFPDYQTQGASLEELQQSLKSLYRDVESGDVPYIRYVSELVVG